MQSIAYHFVANFLLFQKHTPVRGATGVGVMPSNLKRSDLLSEREIQSSILKGIWKNKQVIHTSWFRIWCSVRSIKNSRRKIPTTLSLHKPSNHRNVITESNSVLNYCNSSPLQILLFKKINKKKLLSYKVLNQENRNKNKTSDKES